MTAPRIAAALGLVAGAFTIVAYRRWRWVEA
jgi:hypothetical protein